MSKERITLGNREQQRAQVLNRVLAGQWSQGEAAALLGLSERQVRRLLAAYRERGPAALVHGNRGRRPVHAVSPEVRARVLDLARTTYAGCNDQHLSELLAEAEDEPSLARSTLQRLLRQAGLASPRRRRAPQHRSRRERLPQEGMLLQADGSPHRWLGPTHAALTLVGAIDDATGTVPGAVFRAREDAAGYLLVLEQVLRGYGIPHALYVDHHGIFQKARHHPLTLEEELAGAPVPTQVARALAELGIQVLHARSPQAKGRIERLWGTLQDRLVGELRLAGITTLEAANAFLPSFLERFNARFAVPAAVPGRAYRPLPPELQLAQVLCFKYARRVAADNTVRFGGQTLQLRPGPDRLSYAHAAVEVHERLDGSLAVLHRGHELLSTPAPPSAPTLRARPRSRPDARSARSSPGLLWVPPASADRPAPTPPAPPPERLPWKPATDHPWRKPYKPQRTDSPSS